MGQGRGKIKKFPLLAHVCTLSKKIVAIRQIDYTHTKICHIDWGWCCQIDQNF